MSDYHVIDVKRNFDIETLKTYTNRYMDSELLFFINKELISNFSEEKIVDVYNNSLSVLESTDLIYMISFLENCNSMEITKKFKGGYFYTNSSPNGFYAVVTTTEKWRKIIHLMEFQEEKEISDKLNSLVNNNFIKASSVWPRVFDLNIIDLDKDIRKNLAPCRNDLVLETKIERIHSLSYNYFISGCVMFIIFIIYSQK